MLKMFKVFRKFGLDYCDMPTMVSNINIFLRIITINIDGRNSRPIPLIFYITTLSATACYIYTYVFSMFWFMVYKCRDTGDLVSDILILTSGVSSEIGIVKLIFICYYQGRLKYIVSQCLNDNSEAMGTRFLRNLKRTLRDVKRRAIIYWVVILGSGAAYVAKPIILPGRHLVEDSYVIYGLEPMFETPNYEIACVMLAMSVGFICYSAANITGLLVMIVGYTEAQMMALSEEILHLWRDALDHYHKSSNLGARFDDKNRSEIFKHSVLNKEKLTEELLVNKYINKQLIAIITRHSMNIDLIDQIEAVFKVPIAVGFLLLSLAIIGDLLAGLRNAYLGFLFALVQLSMDCYLGQKLMDASVVFAQAVYNCNWENFDTTNKKMVLMMLQNSQRTMTLSAGGMAKLNFDSLMSMLKSVYSSYTALNSFVRDTS